MSVPISDKLFLNYLQCKYKANLKLTGIGGTKGEYEVFPDDQSSSYRRRAQEHVQQSNQITPHPEATTAFNNIKKQKQGIATDVSVANDRYDLTLDAVELAQHPLHRNPFIIQSSSYHIIRQRSRPNKTSCSVINQHFPQ